MPPKIMIVLSSIRQGRMADRVALAVKKTLEQEGLEHVTLDPMELPQEMIKVPLHFHKDPKDAPKWLVEANEKVKEAAGYIVISAEYNAGVPPPLGSLMCHFPLQSFMHKPAGIVTYSIGPHAGVRAQVALRPFLSEIGLITLPCKNVAVHNVHQTIEKDGKSNSDFITSEIKRLVLEVEWYANALQGHKDKVAPPPPKIYTPRDFGLD